jgi:hypothetical protein
MGLYQVRVITVFTVFRLLTDFVCLYHYEFWLSLYKIVRSSVILLLPLLDGGFAKKNKKNITQPENPYTFIYPVNWEILAYFGIYLYSLVCTFLSYFFPK